MHIYCQCLHGACIQLEWKGQLHYRDRYDRIRCDTSMPGMTGDGVENHYRLFLNTQIKLKAQKNRCTCMMMACHMLHSSILYIYCIYILYVYCMYTTCTCIPFCLYVDYTVCILSIFSRDISYLNNEISCTWSVFCHTNFVWQFCICSTTTHT